MTAPTDLSKEMEALAARLDELELRSTTAPSKSGATKTFFTPKVDLSDEISKVTEIPAPAHSGSSGGGSPKAGGGPQFSSKLPQLETPKFDGKDLQQFLKRLARYFRVSRLNTAEDSLKKGLPCPYVCG